MGQSWQQGWPVFRVTHNLIKSETRNDHEYRENREQKSISTRLMLASQRSNGVWVYQLESFGKSFRVAGRFNERATAHTLQAIALISALQFIGTERYEMLRRSAGGKKPQLLIKTTDVSFLHALQDVIATGKKTPDSRLRVWRQFLMPLWKQLVRFNITFELEQDVPNNRPLINWARRNVICPLNWLTDERFTPQLLSAIA